MNITSPSFFIGKQEKDLISFGSGQPDLGPPKEVYDVLRNDEQYKYGLIQGNVELREKISKGYQSSTREDFVITNGASEALDLVLRVLPKKSGKVLLPEVYYYSYPFNAKFAGMDVLFYKLKSGKIDIEHFKQQVSKCDVVIINSPSNPTGVVQDIETLKTIEKLVAQHSVYLISDEVYKNLIYDRENYLIKGDKVITINSFSKTYSMCGLRIGYLYSKDSQLIQNVIEFKTHTSMNTNVLAEQMALAALSSPNDYITNQLKIWEERRDLIYDGLKELGIDLWKPEGAFYVFPEFKHSQKVINDLYHKYKLITYDGNWFGAKNRIRLSYAIDKNLIKEGLKRITAFMKNEYQKY